MRWYATSWCRPDTRCSAAGGRNTTTSTTPRPSTCWKASAPSTWPSAPTSTLSEGERKRVLIARSLMTDPELLLLDEPAAGLDLGGREELVARLADLAADPDAPAIVLVTHHVEEIPQGFSHCLILSEGTSRRRRAAARRADRGEPVHGVRPVDRAGRHRRPLLRPSHPEPRGAQEAHMTDDPLVPRPAATVMLVRDTAQGIKVFLMRRHSAMDFVAGVMVFPGGGVDDRDRNADIAWSGPEPSWWAQRFGVDTDLAEALVCAAARETFEESGVLFAGPADDPRRHRRRRVGLPRVPRGAGRQLAVVRRVPAHREPGAARRPAAAVGELGDAEGGAHPPLRHLLLRRRVAGGSARRRREHRNRPGRLDHARGRPRRLRRGAHVPAAADLDAAGLAGRPHRRRGAGGGTPDRAG